MSYDDIEARRSRDRDEVHRVHEMARAMQADIKAILQQVETPSGGPEQAVLLDSFLKGVDCYDEIDWPLIMEILRKS